MTPIRVELELADGNFTTRMIRAGQSVQKFKQEVAGSSPALQRMANNGVEVVRSIRRADDVSRSFLGRLRDVSIVVGALSLGFSQLVNIQHSWVGKIIETNAELERMTFMLRGMSTAENPIADAARQVEWLRQQAKEMPFSLDAITNSFVKLKATGTDPMDRSLKNIADGIAAFGGGEEQLKRTILGIYQMSGKGVIQMEEMRQQLAEHMPRAMELMARGMGISVADLVKTIGTGMLSAEEALRAFYDELDRTFGGRAKQMMNTFSGQVQRMKTQLQILATTSTLNSSFFEELKAQIRDFNEFLDGDRAMEFANMLGSGLSSVVSAIRGGIDIVVRFGQEIATVAKIAGAFFAMNMASAGISAGVRAIETLGASLQIVSLRYAAAGAAARDFTIYARLSRSASDAALTAATGFRAAALTAGALASTALTLGPAIVGLGLAAYGAASYFGLLSDKTQEAYEKLEKYGGESRRQAMDIIDAKRRQLSNEIAAERKRLVDEQVMGGLRRENGQLVPDDTIGRLYLLNEEMRKLDEQADSLIQKAGFNEDSRAVSELQRKVEDRLALRQGEYDKSFIALTKYYDAETRKVAEAGGNIDALKRERMEQSFEIARKLYTDQLNDLDEFLAEQKERLNDADTQMEKDAQLRLVNYLTAQQKAIFEKRSMVDVSGPKLLADGGGSAEGIKKAETYLGNLNEKIVKLNAELRGANPELARFQEMLERKDFGDMGEAQVRQLAEEIENATIKMHALEKLRDSRKKAEGDLARIKENLVEREMDLLERSTGRTLTEAERFKARLQAGYYQGLGPAEKIREALQILGGQFDVIGNQSNQLGLVWQNNTFGDPSKSKIETLNDSLRDTYSILQNIGGATGAITFEGFGGPGFAQGIVSAFEPAMASVTSSAAEKMSTAMSYFMEQGWTRAQASGIVGNLYGESGMDPNAVGDNGDAFGLAQWNDRRRALQTYMSMNGLEDNDFMGQLAFVQYELETSEKAAAEALREAKTVKEATDIVMRKFERPSASELTRSFGRRMAGAQTAFGRGAAGVDGAQTTAPSYDAGQANRLQDLVDEQIAASKKLRETADEYIERERKLIAGENDQERLDWIKQTRRDIENLGDAADGSNKRFLSLKEQIASGAFGENRDVNSAQYRDMVELAREYDRVNAEIAEKKEAIGRIETKNKNLEEQKLELQQRIANANRSLKNPLAANVSSGMQSLQRDLDQYVSDIGAAYGRETAKYQEALSLRKSMLSNFLNAEVTEKAAKWREEAMQIRRGLLSQSEQRRLALQEEFAQIDQQVAMFRGSEEEKLRIVEAAEEKKAALREAYASKADPYGDQLARWGDLQARMNETSAQWMNSMSGGLTDLIMGTGDLRSTVQGMTRSLLNTGMNYMFSQMFSKTGAATGALGKAAGGGMKGKAPVMHSGGIVGQAKSFRSVNLAAWKNAPKYHTGGLVGGPKFASDEVPIVARKGEGVFTPEQMQNMGGFQQNQSVTINAPVTVNGSGGTPEQNDDLAKKMSGELEGTLRHIVASEIRVQMRPGNMLGKK